jgi:hypothetical protein
MSLERPQLQAWSLKCQSWYESYWKRQCLHRSG